MKQVNRNYSVSLNFLIVIIFLIDWSLAADFDYKNVDSWVQINPQCGGRRQSPVRIENAELVAKDSDIMFSLINYDKKPLSASLSNDGHTIKVQFVWDENQPPFLGEGVFAENEYVLDSIDFHWSRVNSQGSEHKFTRHGGGLEMHLVHYKRNYSSVENALNFRDGLAIIGGIFEISDQRRQRDTDDWANYISAASQTSRILKEILSNIVFISTPGSSVDIEPFAISEVRPVELSRTAYVTYYGSLTTPPCSESVIWLLSTYPYRITKEQLAFLQSTVEFDHEDDHNNRPVQPMNDRDIFMLWGFPKTIG